MGVFARPAKLIEEGVLVGDGLTIQSNNTVEEARQATNRARPK
jgi:hypothetical protein